MSKQVLVVGGIVVYHDAVGKPFDALITAIHGDPTTPKSTCINLLYVSGDKGAQDPYGRQIVRESSVVYKDWSTMPAHGNYYRFVDDEPNPQVPRIS